MYMQGSVNCIKIVIREVVFPLKCGFIIVQVHVEHLPLLQMRTMCMQVKCCSIDYRKL